MKALQTPRVVVSFSNTTSALAMESACRACAVPGRIVPVPNEISAGCGFAWSAELRHRDRIEAFLAEKQLPHAGVHVLT